MAYYSNDNILLGAPTGSGKTVIAEIAILKLFKEGGNKKAVYVAPLKALARERLRDWGNRFGQLLNKKIVELTGDFTPDIMKLNEADIVITTPEKWDGISRHWQHRSYVKQVALIIFDEIHLLGQDRGPVLEVIISRMRFISKQTGANVRVIGLSTALANAGDIGGWLGVPKQGLYNFKPSVRPVPLQVHIDGFPEKAYCPRMATMNKPAYNAIKLYSRNKPTLIFVSSRRQTRLTAFDLIAQSMADTQGIPQPDREKLEEALWKIQDSNLKHTISFGVGMHHAGLPESDRALIEDLFLNGLILILVTTHTLAWGVNLPAHLVIIKGTEFYDAKEKRYVDFSITDVLQMMGRAGRPQFDDNGIVCIYCQEEKKNFLKTFLYQPFPVESQLHTQLTDHLNAEIASGTIANKSQCIDYLTWTYFFRRLTQNPSYYGISDSTGEKLNQYLQELVDSNLQELDRAGCIKIDKEDSSISSTAIGHIASFYYINYKTAQMFRVLLQSSNNYSCFEILRILSNAFEFSELPVRHNEEILNEELARELPFMVDQNSFESPHTKALLLFQAHLSSAKLPIVDYVTDTKSVMDQAIRVLQSMIDVAAEFENLETALKAMQTLQMLTVGQWHYESSLVILPCFKEQQKKRDEVIYKLYKKHGIECLGQLLELSNQKLIEIFKDCQFSASETSSVQNFLTKIPKMKITWEIQEQEESLWEENQLASITVNLESQNFPLKRPVINKMGGKSRQVGWWVAIAKDKQLLSLKRFTMKKKLLSLKINLPEKPNKLVLINDCYRGIDQEYDL